MNKGTTKSINCTLCKSLNIECFIDLHTFDWNIDGSIIKFSSEKKIEVLDLEEVEQPLTPNFKERQSLTIQSYKISNDKDEFVFKAYLNKVIIKASHLNTRTHIGRVRNTPDRFGDRQLTIKNVSCQNHNSSATSIITVGKEISINNTITNKLSNNAIETSSIKK